MTAPDEVVFRLDAVVRRYPARHYVLVDDKLRMLAAMRKVWGGSTDDRMATPGTFRAGSKERHCRSAG